MTTESSTIEYKNASISDNNTNDITMIDTDVTSTTVTDTDTDTDTDTVTDINATKSTTDTSTNTNSDIGTKSKSVLVATAPPFIFNTSNNTSNTTNASITASASATTVSNDHDKSISISPSKTDTKTKTIAEETIDAVTADDKSNSSSNNNNHNNNSSSPSNDETESPTPIESTTEIQMETDNSENGTETATATSSVVVSNKVSLDPSVSASASASTAASAAAAASTQVSTPTSPSPSPSPSPSQSQSPSPSPSPSAKNDDNNSSSSSDNDQVNSKNNTGNTYATDKTHTASTTIAPTIAAPVTTKTKTPTASTSISTATACDAVVVVSSNEKATTTTTNNNNNTERERNKRSDDNNNDTTAIATATATATTTTTTTAAAAAAATTTTTKDNNSGNDGSSINWIQKRDELRQQINRIQKEKITPKMKAKEDCTADISEMKVLQQELKEVEKQLPTKIVEKSNSKGNNGNKNGTATTNVNTKKDGGTATATATATAVSSKSKSPSPTAPITSPLPPSSSSWSKPLLTSSSSSSNNSKNKQQQQKQQESSQSPPPRPPPTFNNKKQTQTTTLQRPTPNNNKDEGMKVHPIGTPKTDEVINVNIGILGHVDSGKTSLVKTLSTLLSTAALDKSKQSRQRGMTLDLGFSCFFMDLPERLKAQLATGTSGTGTGTTASAGGNYMKKKSNTHSNTTNNTDATAVSSNSKLKYLQLTLVDCPGHASLIRTIIGGAQIIDVVLLVVDAYKGWQAQTTECLVLAELTAPSHLIIALNKIDMFPEAERAQRLEEAKAKVRDRLKNSTKFNAHTVPMIGVSACYGGEKKLASMMNAKEKDNTGSSSSENTIEAIHDQVRSQTINVDKLIELLKDSIPTPRRHLRSVVPSSLTASTSLTTSGGSSTKSSSTNNNNHFYFAIDHCFPIKGMGTVLTGTCLNGAIKVNDIIEFPSLGNLQRKIKSIQMFKRRTLSISQGDRAGICVSNFDASQLERGVCATPGSVKYVKGGIALIRKIIPHYKGHLKNKSKYHVSVGHSTVMATVSFWGAKELKEKQEQEREEEAKKKREDVGNNAKSSSSTTTTAACLGSNADQAGLPYLKFDWNQDFLQQDGLVDTIPTDAYADGNGNGNDATTNNGKKKQKQQQQESLLHWAILDFQTPVYCPLQSLIIGSRLDQQPVEGNNYHRPSKQSKKKSTLTNEDHHHDDDNSPLHDKASSCRLAFCGRLIERLTDPLKEIKNIRWYTPKEKRGIVSRLGDPHKRQDDQKMVRYELYGSDLFKKETLLKPFLGMKVITGGFPAVGSTGNGRYGQGGDIGELKSAFGTSGKFRVVFPAGTTAKEGDILRLPFRRFLYDPEKKMRQDDISIPSARSGSRMDPPDKSSKSSKNKQSTTPNNNNKKNNKKVKKKQLIEATGIVDKVKGETIEIEIEIVEIINPDTVGAGGGTNSKKKKAPTPIPIPNPWTTKTTPTTAETTPTPTKTTTTTKKTKYPTAIVSGLFTPDIDIRGTMVGRTIYIPQTKEYGIIVGPFGKAGKCKVNFIRAAEAVPTTSTPTTKNNDDNENKSSSSSVVEKKKSNTGSTDNDNDNGNGNDNSIKDKLNGISETAVGSKAELHRTQEE